MELLIKWLTVQLEIAEKLEAPQNEIGLIKAILVQAEKTKDGLEIVNHEKQAEIKQLADFYRWLFPKPLKYPPEVYVEKYFEHLEDDTHV